MYYLKFIYQAIATNIKLSLSSRFAFLMTVLSTILKQSLFLLTWKFFFAQYKFVEGWQFKDLLVMYGIVCFAMGFVESFFYGLRDIPRLIDNGQLDTFLLQPKNPILNIALSKGDLSALGEVITGVILIFYSGYMIEAFSQTIFILFLSVVFLFFLNLYLACIAFFMKDSSDFIRELNLNAIIMATQPTAAYRGVIKMITFTLIPVAFMSFLPIEFLRTGSWDYLIYATLGTFIFSGVSLIFFRMGLKRYESGSLIAFRY